ncbi:MAG: hypothetical protein H7256_09325 [Bdellovibrio sp.]|nr:hypothetical protein [Bdellovibrio sp.]
MEKALQFLATYNTQIIKGGFAIIFLLLIIYVYRMFFVVTPASSGDGSATNDALEQKLNQLLENQKNKSAPAGEADEATQGEIDRLKLEVYGLKQQLVEAEKKAGDATATVAAPTDAGTGDPVAMKAQAEKIKSLESRLAEYEIIAEDIAELSQLRTENQKLKDQLAAASSAPVAAPVAAVEEPVAAVFVEEAVASEPVVAVAEPVAVAEVPAPPEEKPAVAQAEKPTADANEQAIQDALAQAAVDEAIAAMNEVKNTSTPLTAQSAQDATDSLLASLAADEEAKAASAPVSEQDQKLLEEFEQTVVKKG